MCGTGNYSIADLKDHHIVSGSTPQFFKTLEWFWAIVAGFTPEEMARLLQFVTGCSQLPPGGFGQLLPKFQFTAAPTYGNLPTAHTWYVTRGGAAQGSGRGTPGPNGVKQQIKSRSPPGSDLTW